MTSKKPIHNNKKDILYNSNHKIKVKIIRIPPEKQLDLTKSPLTITILYLLINCNILSRLRKERRDYINFENGKNIHKNTFKKRIY